MKFEICPKNILKVSCISFSSLYILDVACLSHLRSRSSLPLRKVCMADSKGKRNLKT